MKQYYIYILATVNNKVLYIGATNDLIKRVYQHKQSLVEGFTKSYHVMKLVYYEESIDIKSAITREKQLKKWKREWKDNLINEKNPEWKDLYSQIIG